jgi:hypothetical protein
LYPVQAEIRNTAPIRRNLRADAFSTSYAVV